MKPIVRGTTSQFFDPAFNGINHRTPDEAIAHDGTSYAATLSTTGQPQGIVAKRPSGANYQRHNKPILASNRQHEEELPYAQSGPFSVTKGIEFCNK